MIKQLKRAILITDKKLFGGALAKALEVKKEDFFHNRSSVTLFEPVSDLVLLQNSGNLRIIASEEIKDEALVCDRDLQIISGHGKLIAAIRSGADYVEVQVDNTSSIIPEESNTDERAEKLLARCREKTGPYYCILFPPAADFFGDIVKDIASFEAGNISVRSFEEIETTKESLSAFVRAIYAKDSILQKDLETKLSHIIDATEKYVLGIVSIDVSDPRYRAKKENGMPEPAAIIDLKNAYLYSS